MATDPVALRAIHDGRPASETQAAGGGDGSPGAARERWSAALPMTRTQRTFGVVQFSRPERPFDVFEREAATLLTAQIALLLSPGPGAARPSGPG